MLFSLNSEALKGILGGCDCTRTENVTYFTEEEEELGSLFMQIGIKKNAAKVLVFFTNTPEATSHTIEHGTDLHQPEVCIAMHYLMEQGWITCHESKTENKGRPVKIYKLAKPISGIMDSIEDVMKKEATNNLTLIQKLWDFIS